ncbi:hypothetical protein BH11CYA1_BH11CYA1_23850 [soil metagenome]
MDAQEVLEKSFDVVRDLDTFALDGKWSQFWRSTIDPALKQETVKNLRLVYRKPNEIVLELQDCDDQFKFVGSSTFVKGPTDERPKFIGGGAFAATLGALKLSAIPDELYTFIRFCLARKENSLWYIKRNSFRLVQVKEQANKLILEGDLGTNGIVRLTISSISYFIHSIEITTRPITTEFSREVFTSIVKTGKFFDAITGVPKSKIFEEEVIGSRVIMMETELSFERVSLNPKLTNADFLL